MNRRTCKPAGARRRRGVAVVEAAVVLPLVVLLAFAVIELGWYVNSLQILHNAARHGARAAVPKANSNAEVRAAVLDVLEDSIDVDSSGVTVEIYKLDDSGQEEYQVQNLNNNEDGHPIRVTVTIDYAQMDPPVDFVGLAADQIRSSAVMQRER